ncbi:MAG TPA: hypothetical protein VK149_02740 [Sideroxyarcus sp.]|nr:hypothetical protein [Sideroxyarcus sp.]
MPSMFDCACCPAGSKTIGANRISTGSTVFGDAVCRSNVDSGIFCSGHACDSESPVYGEENDDFAYPAVVDCFYPQPGNDRQIEEQDRAVDRGR